MSLSSTSNMNNIKERHRDGCKSLDFWMHKEKKLYFLMSKFQCLQFICSFLNSKSTL